MRAAGARDTRTWGRGARWGACGWEDGQTSVGWTGVGMRSISLCGHSSLDADLGRPRVGPRAAAARHACGRDGERARLMGGGRGRRTVSVVGVAECSGCDWRRRPGECVRDCGRLRRRVRACLCRGHGRRGGRGNADRPGPGTGGRVFGITCGVSVSHAASVSDSCIPPAIQNC